MVKQNASKTVEERLSDLERRVKTLEEELEPGLRLGGPDDLFNEAVKTVQQYEFASASLLQRRLKVGYARAARILDELEEAGVVGVGQGAQPRKVLAEQKNNS